MAVAGNQEDEEEEGEGDGVKFSKAKGQVVAVEILVMMTEELVMRAV